MSFGSNASGVHTSTSVLVGNSNAGDITPTTVKGTESSWMVRPMTDRIRAERARPEAVAEHHHAIRADHCSHPP